MQSIIKQKKMHYALIHSMHHDAVFTSQKVYVTATRVTWLYQEFSLYVISRRDSMFRVQR